MPNITQSPNRPNGAARNVQEFLSKEVSAPLCLRKLSIGSAHHESFNNAKRGAAAAFPRKFDTERDEIHFGDFLCPDTSYEDGQSTPVKEKGRDPNIKLLVNQALDLIYERVGNILSLLLDQFEDRSTAHRVFIERTHHCRQLFQSIQNLSDHAYELGRHTGREDGLDVIRKVLGTNPTGARIHKFTTLFEDGISGDCFGHLVDKSHYRIGVTVDDTQERISHMTPHQVESARTAWESVEDQIGQLLLFQLRCVLDSLNVEDDDEDGSNKEDVVDAMYRQDLTDVLYSALDKTFYVGCFEGFHVAQERYKNLYGISNPWTYSFIDVDSDNALVVSKHSRVIPKVAMKSIPKRLKKI